MYLGNVNFTGIDIKLQRTLVIKIFGRKDYKFVFKSNNMARFEFLLQLVVINSIKIPKQHNCTGIYIVYKLAAQVIDFIDMP